MSLQEQIKTDMVIAMKNRDSEVLSLLRVISGEFSRIGKEINDQDAIKIIHKMNENAEEMANSFETKILEKYLPKMLSEEEIKTIVKKIIIENNFTKIIEMGSVMVKLKQLPVASQIDGKISSKIVKEMLIS